jgi:hypothetical protein
MEKGSSARYDVLRGTRLRHWIHVMGGDRERLTEHHTGEPAVYKLRDWLFSRQCYLGRAVPDRLRRQRSSAGSAIYGLGIDRFSPLYGEPRQAVSTRRRHECAEARLLADAP